MNDRKMYWITKHAFSEGVLEKFCTCRISNGAAFVDINKYCTYFRLGIDAYETKEAALTRVEEMRAAKIESLKRQRAKLDALMFE